MGEQSTTIRSLQDAFTFSFRGQGPPTLVAGTIFFAIIDLLLTVGFIPILSILLLLPALACLVSYLISVIRCVAYEESELPDWPEITREELIFPALRFVVAAAIGLLPAIVIVSVVTGWSGISETPPWVIGSLTLLYLPMALLAVALHESFLAASPHIVLPAIWRTRVRYALVCVLLVLFPAVRNFVIMAIPGFLGPLGLLACNAVSLYVSITSAVLLGMLYRDQHRVLRWFPEDGSLELVERR